MSLLQSVNKGKRQMPPRLLIYGIEGIGKSTLGASAPDPIFIPTEDGLDRIDTDSFPLCQSFEDMMKCVQSLKNEKHSYRTVVLDSADWGENLIFARVCKQFGATTVGKADGGYQRGYEHALNYWHQLIAALGELRNEKGMIIILIAHAKIEKHDDPETTPFDRFSPKLHQKANALLCEWCTGRSSIFTRVAGWKERSTPGLKPFARIGSTTRITVKTGCRCGSTARLSIRTGGRRPT